MLSHLSSQETQAARVSLQAIWPQNFLTTFPQMGPVISGRALAPVKALKALASHSVANTRVQSGVFSHPTRSVFKRHRLPWTCCCHTQIMTALSGHVAAPEVSWLSPRCACFSAGGKGTTGPGSSSTSHPTTLRISQQVMLRRWRSRYVSIICGRGLWRSPWSYLGVGVSLQSLAVEQAE